MRLDLQLKLLPFVALVRSFPDGNFLVLSKWGSKGFLTFPALMRPFSHVKSCVLNEVTGTGAEFPIYSALIMPCSSVNSFVQ